MKQTKLESIKEVAEVRALSDDINHQFDHFFDLIIECGIATEEEIILVCTINGTSVKSLLDILYARTSLRTFSQLLEDYLECPF